MTPSVASPRTGAWNWGAGAVGGVVAAFVYTVFVEAINLLTNGPEAFFVPFRQISAIVLGRPALEPAYDLATAVLTGTAVHFAIGAAFGALVAWIAASLNSPSRTAIVGLGLILGLAFYALNVFVVFPAAFPWFLANDRLTQSIGHGLFGAVTGAWISWRCSVRRPEGGERGNQKSPGAVSP